MTQTCVLTVKITEKKTQVSRSILSGQYLNVDANEIQLKLASSRQVFVLQKLISDLAIKEEAARIKLRDFSSTEISDSVQVVVLDNIFKISV